MKKLIVALSTISCFSIACGQAIDTPFGKSGDVTGLTMILSGVVLPGGPNLTEARLPEVGCTFHVSNPALIAEVLSILEPGIYGTSTAPTRLRHAIYVSMRNQGIVKYLLAEQQGTRGTVGSIDAATNGKPLYFFPKREAPDQLRTWARTHIDQLSFSPPTSDPTNPCTFWP